MNHIPEELRPWVDQLRHRIDASTPQIATEWSRTEVCSLAVVMWFTGFAEGLTVNDSTPGMPPGLAERLYASADLRKYLATMCMQVADGLIAEVDRAG